MLYYSCLNLGINDNLKNQKKLQSRFNHDKCDYSGFHVGQPQIPVGAKHSGTKFFIWFQRLFAVMLRPY
ncbi:MULTISPECIES: hypothetical protein [Planktothricoides]|uniref:Transposase n=1 Tax=Planktothricoides raciborskii FACHB-1370 TaxID=2949576 RepID=A0ABR8EP42_9CYAN|nr:MULTISPECIES: hypothetical protein [Planktothricoides]MBD2547665.1 hypothetical protein [Planktothricoides raciborskii FACHB-1370]MBD2585188.1 hypothetical protein [Planktothricoides raciborskii FACHB-1261]